MKSLSNAISRRTRRLLVLGGLTAVLMVVAPMFAAGQASADTPEPDPQRQLIVVGGQLKITTNQSFYGVGQHIEVCYEVPAAGWIHITDHQGQSGQFVHTLLYGYDDGTGGCFVGVITPPFGHECLKITYWFPHGGPLTKQTCFTVLGAL